MNITDSEKCTFYNEFEETVENLMFACTYTNSFWIRVKKWLERFRIITDFWKEFDVMFRVLNTSTLTWLTTY